ncbi:DinB family protein [Hwangdonia sp.]|uniref:DinB family protein n=1 Tax=Hwangdonia sp. TaxID=1883432 RepID=UPI003AB43EDC
MTVKDLNTTEYNSYYGPYIKKLPENLALIDGFTEGLDNVLQFFHSVPSEKLEYRYAEGKWSVKEVFQHIIDTERVFMYRCFRIARHDKTPLPGFNQDDYIMPSQAHKKSMATLLLEYSSVRKNSITLLNSLSNEDLKFVGTASENTLSARAAAFIILGHEIWHIDVIKTHYL